MPKGFSVTQTSRKISVSADQQDGQRDFIRRFLPPRAFNQRDHAVQETSCPDSAVTRIMISVADSTRVPPVTALRSPPLSRMTGADSPVMADSSTVAAPSITSPSAGMMSPASHDHDVAFAQVGGADFLHLAVFARGGGRWFLRASCAGPVGLGLAAAFGHGFGEIGEQDGEPEPEGELGDEAALGRGGENADGGQRRADHGDEHDRVLDHQARVELFEGVAHGRPGDFPIKKRRSFCVIDRISDVAVKTVFPGA